MKNSLKAAISVFILSTLYFVFSGVFATCTLTLDNYQCNEDEACSLTTGCLCFGNTIAYNDTCNGATISVDNAGVPATAFSGNLITFRYTVTSYTGDKYFVLHLPLTIDYGIKYLNASFVPDNNILLSLGMANDPIFTVHAGETKTFIITGNVVAQYRAILPMRATGSVYKDSLLQQLSVQALSSVMDPGPYITIAKSVSGTMPGFSGDTMEYTVTLQNIGSLGVVDLAFLERFPVTYLYAPVISFDGTVQNYSSFISPNLYVYSGAYLVLNPGQIINIVVSSFLKDNFSPVSFINTAAFTTGGSLTPSAQNIAIATGNIPAYLDVFASTITTGSTDPEMSGDAFAFTINYGQQGNMSATGMTMTLTVTGTNISGATYNLPNLTIGATGTYTVTGTLNANYTSGTLVCANAYLASVGETESTGNNTIVGCYRVAPIADVMVTKQISPSIVLENLVSGSNISYVITVTNTGTKIATGITLTDTLPSQLTYVSNNFGTPTIVGNQLTWILNNLNPGASTSIILTGSINNYPNAGMDIINTGVITTASRESLTSNNQFVLTTHLSGISDVYITKTSSAISGFKAGTPVVYTINYGNAGGKTASGVVITDTFPSTLLSTPTTSRNIGSLTPGQTGTIVITGTMINDLPAGQTIANSIHIATSTVQLSTTNDDAVVTGTVPVVDGTYIDLVANNITRPALDNPPYGTNQSTMIQAVSGDVIRFTITYGDNGNVMANNASISLGSLGGIASIQNTTVSVGTLNTGATLIMTGIVGPKNFITFSPTATLNYNTNQFKSDSLIVNEPLACGDGLVTRTEECDINGPVGNILPGQECENQQGACVLVTKFIINNACISFGYSTMTGAGTGQACDGETIPLTQASCASVSVNGSAVTCNANNANANTRIAINCGNGTIFSGFGTTLTATCTSGGTTATCLVGGETTVAPACSQPLNGGACTVNTLDGDMIVLDEDGNGDMAVVCEANDGSELDNATVDCGADGDYHNGVCEYTDINNTPAQRTIRCAVAGGVSCEKDLIADQGFLAECGNGDPEGYEQCDDGNNDNDDECSNHCTRNDRDYTPPACFIVNNGNISIQKGEKMPFRWTLEINKKTLDTVSSENSAHECEPGDINRDSMDCTFEIYNGENKQSDEHPTKTFTEKCYNPNGRTNYTTLFQPFTNSTLFPSQAKAFGRYAFDISSSLTDDIFGEYKLSLASVKYDYCGSDGNRKRGEIVDRICDVNFTVTRPYIAQKSTFGLTPKIADDIDLTNYFTIQGKPIVSETQLDQMITVDANDYKGGTKINTMTDAFIKKYEKLAIKINGLSSLEGLNDVTNLVLKKVPNQNIYIIQGQGKITLNGGFTTPFTMITKGIDVHVKGDLTTNGMFLVDGGDIYFDEPAATRCGKTQEVKGIFVVNDGKFISEPLANIDNDYSRCNYGGLYVKGVLIGNGIDTLVKNRRSQLNSRFSTTQIAARRNKIFNGAAVLIEYSPSLRSALPPGANEFTKALEVYKK